MFQEKQYMGNGSFLQRKCTCGRYKSSESTCTCQKTRDRFQRAAMVHEPTDRNANARVPPIVHQVLRSPGQPLDTQTRAFFEPRFRHSFSHVRVHTDEHAATSAQALNALAYTVGRNVVFGPSQYSPQSTAGRHLLAHELAHVVHQSFINDRPLGTGQISKPSEAAEIEADRSATAVMHGPQGLPELGGRQPSRPTPLPGVIYRAVTLWPFNGYVINNYTKPITVWSYERNEYSIPGGATSGRFTEDVDHIKDEGGQWYKIGANTVTVDAAGKIEGYKCKVNKSGEDCPPLEKPERSLTPAVSTGVAPRIHPRDGEASR